MTLDDYPPWIRNAAREIVDRDKVTLNIIQPMVLAEIISRHHEVEPKFVQPTPADIARVLGMKDEIEKLKQDMDESQE